MSALKELPNIGKVLEEQLREIGVETPEQLRQTGAKEAWLKIKQNDPSACYNRLCGLEGAVRGVRWHSLDDKTKAELKEFYRENK